MVPLSPKPGRQVTGVQVMPSEEVDPAAHAVHVAVPPALMELDEHASQAVPSELRPKPGEQVIGVQDCESVEQEVQVVLVGQTMQVAF